MFSRTVLWLAVAAYVAHAIVLHRKLDRITKQGASTMTKIDDVNTLLTKIDDETNAVAAEVTALKDQIANSGGLSAADADGVVARLGAISDRLTGIGADPSNPVPEAPPAEPGAPGGGTNG